MNNFRAADSPFHISDCHIRNHSPATVMNANPNRSAHNVNPMVAGFFALSNSSGVDLIFLNNFMIPYQQKKAMANSHKMISI